MILKILYPHSETTKETITISSIVGGVSYLLLIIYQPFGTSQFEHPHKYLLLFPYAIITSFSISSIHLLSGRNNKNWTVGLELLKIFLVLLSTSILSYFYNIFFISKVSPAFENFLYMFLYTSALGLPVLVMYILGRYIYLDKKNKPGFVNNKINNGHAFVPTPVVETKNSNTELHIVADYGNFHLYIKQDDFVYAEAVDNYCFIHFYKNAIIHREIIRISLTKLLDQLQTHAIKRVHRSFIVNLEKVKKYKGNASGYKISLHDIDNELVISRSYVDSIVPVLKTFVVCP